ncbi:MAG: hypothetical protein QXN17_01460 [Nitrososphaerota archaeon]
MRRRLRRSGTTAIALVAVALALLIGAVILASTLSRTALEPTAKEVIVKEGEFTRRGIRATISKGLLGYSLNTWLTIHDLYGYGESIDYLIGVDWNDRVSYELNTIIDVKPCMIKKTEGLGFPPTFEKLNATYKKIIIHTKSGGVAEVEYRPSPPTIDEIYPCTIDQPQSKVYTIVVKVWLVDCKGHENACGGCDCYSYDYLCEKPFCNPSGPPHGNYSQGVPHQPYGILQLTAQKEITYKNKKYVFQGWLIELVPPKEGSEWYYDTTLRLFVDDRYHIKLVYREVC